MKSCRNCPYIRSEIKQLRSDLFTSDNSIIDSFWCEKLGGIIGLCGYCGEEADNVAMSGNTRNPKKLSKRERDRKYKHRLAYLADNLWWGPSGACRIGHDNHYTNDPNNTKYIKRYYRGRRSPTLKKIGNKKVRRYKGYIPNNGGYKKIFDFWWELY